MQRRPLASDCERCPAAQHQSEVPHELILAWARLTVRQLDRHHLECRRVRMHVDELQRARATVEPIVVLLRQGDHRRAILHGPGNSFGGTVHIVQTAILSPVFGLTFSSKSPPAMKTGSRAIDTRTRCFLPPVSGHSSQLDIGMRQRRSAHDHFHT